MRRNHLQIGWLSRKRSMKLKLKLKLKMAEIERYDRAQTGWE